MSPVAPPLELKAAAVCLIERADLLLVVWNRRYRGWTLPGGMVEADETPHSAVIREVHEETGLWISQIVPIYDAATPIVVNPHRGEHVFVFRATERDIEWWVPREMEVGSPVSWFTREDFLASCPFSAFYTRMFRVLENASAQ